MDVEGFERRKRAHLQHSLDPANQALGRSGLANIRLIHEALPEIDFEEVRIESPCLGRPLPTPFYVAGMTAGHADAPALNRRLALACARRGWAMGVGSQRRELETAGSALGVPDAWKKLRDEVPSLMLFANLGLSQLVGARGEAIQKLVDSLGAQALAVHVNALQEALQPEGTPRFRGGLEALAQIVRGLSVPVVLKETGCGFSARTLSRIASLGLAAVDVSGLGGTHWGRIEGARAQEEEGQASLRALAAKDFAFWGEPTSDSVVAAKDVLPQNIEIWASGGVRSGLDAAKLIALGAHRVGYAKPALEAAIAGDAALDHWMELQEFELQVALFCTGSRTPKELRAKEGSWTAVSVN